MKYTQYLFFAAVLIYFTYCTPQKQDQKTQEEAEEPVIKNKITYPKNLEAAFRAHGGVERWKSYGTLKYDLVRGENTEHHIIDLNNRKVLLTSESYNIGFDGREVWISPDKSAMAGGSARFYHNLFFYFFSIPLIFSDPGINFEDLGQSELNGKSYNAVKVSYDTNIGDSPDDFYIPYFDPETNKMEALLYTVTYRSGEATENYNALIYDEWNEVNGLVLPASMKGYKYENGEIGEERYAAEFKNIAFKKERPNQEIFEMPEVAEIDSLVSR